jgi:hypothetical protein
MGIYLAVCPTHLLSGIGVGGSVFGGFVISATGDFDFYVDAKNFTSLFT